MKEQFAFSVSNSGLERRFDGCCSRRGALGRAAPRSLFTPTPTPTPRQPSNKHTALDLPLDALGPHRPTMSKQKTSNRLSFPGVGAGRERNPEGVSPGAGKATAGHSQLPTLPVVTPRLRASPGQPAGKVGGTRALERSSFLAYPLLLIAKVSRDVN